MSTVKPGDQDTKQATLQPGGGPLRESCRVADPRLRILIVASTLHVGGAEMVMANLARYLDARRFDVLVCCLREIGVVGELITGAGIELVSLPKPKPGRTDYWTSLKLRRLVRGRRIQVMHSHDTHGLLDCSIVRCVTRAVRHVHTFHYGNYPNLDPWDARLERLVWRRPDRLVAVGHAQAKTIAQYYRMAPARLSMLRNGVEEHAPILDQSLVSTIGSNGRPVVASISTLIEQKGLYCLLDAVAIVIRSGLDMVLVLAGDGILRSGLQRHAEALGIAGHVRFLGWVPEASRHILPLCDVFVQSSLWEAMSIVVLEAMAAHKPMVVTSVGENPVILEDNRSALIVPPGDSAALAAALGRLISEPQTAWRLGEAAFSKFRKELTVEQMVRGYERLYQDVVAAEPHKPPLSPGRAS